MIGWIVGGVAAVALYGWYATIVARRNRVGEALGGIDAQLTQRHELIPNLLAVAKRFLTHEQGLLQEITRLRAEGERQLGVTDPQMLRSKFADAERLGNDVRRLIAVAEDYPELAAHEPLLEAMATMQEVDTNIAAARRTYNAAVADLRNAVQIVPGPLLARLAGVATLPPFYESQPDQRAPVRAAGLL